MRRNQPGLPAGKLNQWLIFEVATVTQDSTRAEIKTWATDFGVPGGFDALGSREFPTFQQRHEQTTARFTIRYRTGIDAGTHRISYNGQIWDIQPPIDPDGRRFQLLIEATETK